MGDIVKVFSVIKRIFDVVFILGIVAVVIALVLVADAVINNETPSLFGYTIYRVTSTSMEPLLQENEVILSQLVLDDTKLNTGDIVTIKRENERESITHMVIKPPYENHGKMMIQTKGVANDVADPPVYTKYVESKYVKTLHTFDSIYKVLLSPLSVFLFLFLILYMVFDEVFFRYKRKNDAY